MQAYTNGGTLEQLLNFPHNDDLTIQLDGKKIPVYIFPIDIQKNTVYGSFPTDNGTHQQPICFTHKTSFLTKQYYQLNTQGKLTKNPINQKRNRTVYLPLQTTKYTITLPNQKKPAQLFGLHGTPHPYPILLTTCDDENFLYKVIYKSNNGHPQTHTITNEKLSKKIIPFLKTWKPKEHSKPKKSTKKNTTEDPQTIIKYLNDYIIRQDQAKQTIATIISTYLICKANNIEPPKDNLLLAGPTGTGKTYLVDLLAKHVDIPFIKKKMTGKSSEGHVGENFTASIANSIRAKTNEEAPYAIIFLDEIDKLTEEDEHHSFGKLLQDELIGMLEETEIGTENPVSTKNILFIAAGAFQEKPTLHDIIQERTGEKKPFGFNDTGKEKTTLTTLHDATPQDFITYGLKPELIGRFATTTSFDPLTQDDLVHILKEAKESRIKRYEKIFAAKNYTLEIEQQALHTIAKHCPQETGARALNTTCLTLFKPILLNTKKYANNKKIIITPEIVEEIFEKKTREPL